MQTFHAISVPALWLHLWPDAGVVLQVFLLHGHLRQAHAANAQLRNYNKLLNEQHEHETKLLKTQLAEQRLTVEDSIAVQRAVESMAKDTQTTAAAEISLNRRRYVEVQKSLSQLERRSLQRIADLQEQLRSSLTEQHHLRLQKDALARSFATIANEILGGSAASADVIAQVW